MSDDGQWHEIANGVSERQHTVADVVRALGAPEPTMVLSERD